MWEASENGGKVFQIRSISCGTALAHRRLQAEQIDINVIEVSIDHVVVAVVQINDRDGSGGLSAHFKSGALAGSKSIPRPGAVAPGR
jgi:hypothetical protein